MKPADVALYRMNATVGPVSGADEIRKAAEDAGFTVVAVRLTPCVGKSGWEFIVRVTSWPSECCDECGRMISPTTHAPIKGMPEALQCL